jgi:hypothetical protein
MKTLDQGVFTHSNIAVKAFLNIVPVLKKMPKRSRNNNVFIDSNNTTHDLRNIKYWQIFEMYSAFHPELQYCINTIRPDYTSVIVCATEKERNKLVDMLTDQEIGKRISYFEEIS